MGEYNKEQDVAQLKRRKDALKGVDASLRDQNLTKLVDKLEEMDIGGHVKKIWQIGNANRTAWLERQEVYLSDWDEFLVNNASGPFEGSSNLHMPMPLIVAKTIHARFMQALLGIDPNFLIKSRTEANKDRAMMLTDFMRYTLMEWVNYHRGIELSVDQWLWSWITDGSGILKGRWDCLYEKYVDVQTVKEQGPPVFKTDPATGREVMQRVMKDVEKEIEVTKKIFEGPVFESRPMEDVLIIGGGGDPQLADSVTDRYFLNASEMWTLADRKVFRPEIVKDIVAGGPDYNTAGAVAASIKYDRAEDAGKAALRTTAELDKYEILECYMKLDVDGSGINSEIVVWVHYRTGKILRANYLRRMIKSGERPLFKIDYHKRPDSEYGVGIIEMMHPLSIELDAIRNMRIDFGLISTMPFGFYRPTSSLNPETIQLEPGALIPLDNPQTDVYFPNFSNRTALGFQEEQAIMTMIERLTGINDLNQGVITGAQGATRTATGARALLGESNANLDVHLRRLNQGWKFALKFLLHMLQQRTPTGLTFRVLGDNGQDYWATIKDTSDLEGDYDFEVAPNSANSNQQIMEQVAQDIMQLTSNPMDIQLGIIGPGQRYEAIKNWFRVKGIKDFGRYCVAPPNYQYLMTPEEEANRLLRGIEVPLTPQMDHQGFIDYFNYVEQHDELLGQFNEEQVLTLFAQVKKHQAMLAALQQLQSQQQNLAQQQVNQQQAAPSPARGAMQESKGPAPTPAALSPGQAAPGFGG